MLKAGETMPNHEEQKREILVVSYGRCEREEPSALENKQISTKSLDFF
jgi:hypothetical protein